MRLGAQQAVLGAAAWSSCTQTDGTMAASRTALVLTGVYMYVTAITSLQLADQCDSVIIV